MVQLAANSQEVLAKQRTEIKDSARIICQLRESFSDLGDELGDQPQQQKENICAVLTALHAFECDVPLAEVNWIEAK